MSHLQPLLQPPGFDIVADNMSFLPSASMFAKFLLFPSGQCFHKDPGWSWHFCISATFGANFIQCCVFIPWTFSVEKSPDSFVCLILENCIQDLLHAKQKTKCLPHPPRYKTGHIIACLFVLCAIYPVGIFRDTSVVCAGPLSFPFRCIALPTRTCMTSLFSC